MVCLGLKLRAVGWKAQTNLLSYGCTPLSRNFVLPFELPKAFAPTNLRNTIMYLTKFLG